MTDGFSLPAPDASPFEYALGRLHGRVVVDGAPRLVLGSVDPDFLAPTAPGDFVEIFRLVDLTGASVVRLGGTAEAAAGEWELSITVDEVPRVRVKLGPRARPLGDVVAPVADLDGVHRIALRLTRVA